MQISVSRPTIISSFSFLYFGHFAASTLLFLLLTHILTQLSSGLCHPLLHFVAADPTFLCGFSFPVFVGFFPTQYRLGREAERTKKWLFWFKVYSVTIYPLRSKKHIWEKIHCLFCKLSWYSTIAHPNVNMNIFYERHLCAFIKRVIRGQNVAKYSKRHLPSSVAAWLDWGGNCDSTLGSWKA